jgi:hypothetical protein
MMLSAFGFVRSQQWLSRLVRPLRTDPATTRTPDDAARLTWAVQTAARGLPDQFTCLPQALSLWLLLARRGQVAHIHFGVRMAASGVEAHAWVELDGAVLGQTAAHQSQFVALRPNRPDQSVQRGKMTRHRLVATGQEAPNVLADHGQMLVTRWIFKSKDRQRIGERGDLGQHS